MSPRKRNPPSGIPPRPPTPRRALKVLFLSDGTQRRVALRAPGPIHNAGRWMVRLIDLWVASLLPGDLLDLRFQIVARDTRGLLRRFPSIDPLHFARGFIDLGRGALWWDDPLDGALNGLRVQSIVAVRSAPPVTLTPPPPAPSPGSTVALARLLPLATRAYPRVERRSVPVDDPTPPLDSTATQQ